MCMWNRVIDLIVFQWYFEVTLVLFEEKNSSDKISQLSGKGKADAVVPKLHTFHPNGKHVHFVYRPLLCAPESVCK